MARRVRYDNAAVAIRDGIATRLLELGFERKSARLFLREDDRFQEWAHFSISDPRKFSDFIGIFDKDLHALFEKCMSPGRDSSVFSTGRSGHTGTSAIRMWRKSEAARVQALIDRRNGWNPLNWFWPSPRRSDYRSPFVTEWGDWQAEHDPQGCAAASLAKWRELVEPWRMGILTDRRALILDYLDWLHGGSDFQKIVCYVYLGEIRQAEMFCRNILDTEGMAPSEAELNSYVRKSWSADQTRNFIRSSVKWSFQLAEMVRRIAPVLGLRP